MSENPTQAQTITKDEFAKAMELREKDFQLQKMSIDHDKDRLRVLESQCAAENRKSDAQNRLTALLERITDIGFLWHVAAIVSSCVLLSALAIRLCAFINA